MEYIDISNVITGWTLGAIFWITLGLINRVYHYIKGMVMP